MCGEISCISYFVYMAWREKRKQTNLYIGIYYAEKCTVCLIFVFDILTLIKDTHREKAP